MRGIFVFRVAVGYTNTTTSSAINARDIFVRTLRLVVLMYGRIGLSLGYHRTPSDEAPSAAS